MRFVKLIIFLVLLSSLVLADSHQLIVDPQDPLFNDDIYADEAAYQDPAFYLHTDISEWDWNYVSDNWDKVSFDREEIYYHPELYSNLDDHTLIEPEAYLSALGCETCLISLSDENAENHPIYSELGIADQGGNNFVSIPGNLPEGTEFTVFEDEIMVTLPAEATYYEIYSDEDSFLLRYWAIGGDELLLAENVRFNGIILVDQGQYYLTDGDFVSFNGWLANPDTEHSEFDGPVIVTFDGEEQEGNYLTFVGDNYIAGRGVLIDNDDGTADLLGEYEQDKLFSLHSYGTFTLERRDGLTPLLQMENGFLLNGQAFYQVYEGEFSHRGFYFAEGIERTFFEGDLVFQNDEVSYPLTLIAVDENGENTLEVDGQAQKIFFDGLNNYRFIDADEEAATSACETCSDDVSYYRTDDNVGVPLFSGGGDPFSNLPPIFQDLNVNYFVVSNEEITRICQLDYAAGCYIPAANIIVVKEDRRFQRSMPHHEFAHVWQDQRTDSFNSDMLPAVRVLIQTQELYGSLTDDQRSLLISEVWDFASQFNDFDHGWARIAGVHDGTDPYGQSVYSSAEGFTWPDGSTGPRHGMTRPYGAMSEHEDFAEYMEAIGSWSDWEWQEAFATGDPRYEQKLDFLLEYELITEENHDRIMGYAE